MSVRVGSQQEVHAATHRKGAKGLDWGLRTAHRNGVVCGLVLLILAYTWRYLGYPALPGNQVGYPLGWWGWWDQSKTLESTAALAHLDFAPAHHWYPLGYALLGAPFYRPMPMHAFFFVDLAALLLAYGGFIALCRRVGVSALVAAAIFVFTTLGDHFLFAQWVIPWNTSASGALVWLLLACTASHLQETRRPFVIGLLGAAVPMFRPTDMVLVAPCVAAVLVMDAIRLRSVPHALLWVWMRLAVGFVLPALGYAALYLRIYGPHPNDYMLISRQIGFTLHDFGWKSYVILVNPQPWFRDGEGFLQHDPWLALGFAGLAPALLGKFLGKPGSANLIAALLAVVLIIHAVLYLAYVDLLPTGFWRYDNVHYWAWILPGYGLLAWLLLRDLMARHAPRAQAAAWVSLMATGLVVCIHIDPVPIPMTAKAMAGVKMVDFPGATGSFADAYFSPLMLRDAAGRLQNIKDMRVIPVPGGVRAIALRREIDGPVAWVPGHGPALPADAPPPVYWRMGFKLGRPCWLIGCRLPPGSPEMPPFDKS